MMFRHVRHTVGAVLLAAIAASASAQPASPGAARTAQTLSYSAMDFAFRGPTTATPGLATIRLTNTGQKLHHIQLFRLTGGRRMAELFPLLVANKSIHGAPEWAVPSGGPSAALPGQSIRVRQRLEPGYYAVICWIPAPDGQPHFMKGMVTELQVVGAAAPMSEPAADVRVTLREYTATLSTPLTSGRHTLRIENIGRQDHEFLLVRLKPGRSPEDVERWSGGGQIGPPPIEEWMGLAGIGPGAVAWLDVELTAGRYVILCLAPDESDGKPHFHHGFRQLVTVR
jgi:hypothetical protein